MAGDWMGIDHELPEKPEVLGIHERTGVPIDTIVGRLVMLWRLGDRQTTDGLIRFAGPKSLVQRCGGNEDFWQAVADVGWLIFSPAGAQIPDFTRRFGQSSRRRLLDAMRKHTIRASARDADKVRTRCGRSAPPESESQPESEPLPLPESESESQPDDGGFAAQNLVGQKPDGSADIRAVFDHYRQYHPKACPKPTSTSKEWRAVAARLAEGFTAEDVCEAIDGCHRTPFNLGANEQGQRYLNLGLIVRDSDHVNRFIENARHPPSPSNERERRTLDAAQRWIQRGEA